VIAVVWRGHLAHLVIFGIPVAGLVAAVGWQEIRGRYGKRDPWDSIGRRSAGLRVAAAGLVAAAVIHAVAIPEHFREYWLYGAFFVALTAAQLLLAVVVTFRPERRTVQFIAVGSVSILALWLITRTGGLPVGPEPWRPESFGDLDIAASCAELATSLGCLVHLSMIHDRRRMLARWTRPELLP
jgi:hypothetical protein